MTSSSVNHGGRKQPHIRYASVIDTFSAREGYGLVASKVGYGGICLTKTDRKRNNITSVGEGLGPPETLNFAFSAGGASPSPTG